MPRQPRTELGQAVHHITCRGPSEFPVFRDDDSRMTYLAILGNVSSEYGWTALAYSVLSTHVHLLLWVPDASLGAGMRKVNTRYAMWLNREIERRGRVWGDRFHSQPVRSARHLANTVVYIDLNAVEAGISREPARWGWDSARANIGVARPRRWHDPERARRAVGAAEGGLSPEGYAELLRHLARPVVEGLSPEGLSLRGQSLA